MYVYRCNTFSQKWFTAALQHHLLRWASKTLPAKHLFLQHSFALFLPKAYQQFNPTSCRLGQCSSFHISTISTCFISLAQDLMLQPHEFCLRLLTLRYHYEETICCSPFFLSSKYKNKNNWLRTWAQGEQIPFCSLPPLLAVLNSHCLQTPLRKTNFNSYTK